MPARLLSKSKFLNGLQCPKLLWLLLHQPDMVPEPDAATQHVFDQGHAVGEIARDLYPDGISIPDESFTGNLKETGRLLNQGATLFEAGILAGDLYSRIDVLEPAGGNEWDVIEVKSTTSVKAVHLYDLAFQKLCCQRAGLEIRRCLLVHIDNQYVKEGEIDPHRFFTVVDVTDDVAGLGSAVADKVEDLMEVIGTDVCPDGGIGPHCSDPYPCAVSSCWDFLPENSVCQLYYGGKKSFGLIDDGILAIEHIPATFRLNAKQQIQKECVLTGRSHVDGAALRAFLGTLEYPLSYLDFETFNTAVPMFDGLRPYQRVPFQFSLHIVRDRDSGPEHHSFLAEGRDDPRTDFMTVLMEVLPQRGSVVVYNATFEKGVLRELAATFPQHAHWVQDMTGRMVDLMLPFRDFHYHCAEQKGSASLKAVLPALVGKSYAGMAIDNGEDASLAFLQTNYGDVSREERLRVREALLQYCGLDTEGMTWIVDKLRDLAGGVAG